jgi:tetratricopeptide (TPR) repeat protein
LAFHVYDLDAMNTKPAVAFALVLLAGRSPCYAQTSDSARQQLEAHSQKAHALLEQKRPDLAIAEFQAVVALDPKNADALANLGVLHFFQGDYAKANPELRNALNVQPNIPKIQALLGMSEKRNGDTSTALKDLEASFPLINEKNIRVQSGMELIELYSASGDLDKAAQTIGVLKQLDPENTRVLYTAYRIYSDLAGESMLSLSLVAPDSAEMHQVMAHEEARQGNDASAIAQYRKAIAIDPKLPGIHFELAELLYSSQYPKVKGTAETEYKSALDANPFDEKAAFRLGEIYAQQGNLQKAYDSYSQSVRLQPSDADANFGLAKTLIAMGQSSNALPALERAVELDPTNAAAHFRLSTLYREAGRPEDSRREVEQYKKYKELKEKLRALYKEMRLSPNERSSAESEDK